MISETLEQKAEELVSYLKIEYISDIMISQEQGLIQIGEPAIKPLEKFIATEGTDYSRYIEQDIPCPSQANYDSAKRVLNQIKSNLL